MMFNYPANLIQQSDGGFLVTFDDVPEAITQGDTLEEALKYAIEAIDTALTFYMDENQKLPKPSKPKYQQKTVCPSKLMHKTFYDYQYRIELENAQHTLNPAFTRYARKLDIQSSSIALGTEQLKNLARLVETQHKSSIILTRSLCR